MDKSSIITQLKTKYNEIFPQYLEILIKKLDEPNNIELAKIYNYLNTNIKYIEKYISLLNMEDSENLEKEIEKINIIKQLDDSLYEPKNKNNLHCSSKIEIINE